MTQPPLLTHCDLLPSEALLGGKAKLGLCLRQVFGFAFGLSNSKCFPQKSCPEIYTVMGRRLKVSTGPQPLSSAKAQVWGYALWELEDPIPANCSRVERWPQRRTGGFRKRGKDHEVCKSPGVGAKAFGRAAATGGDSRTWGRVTRTGRVNAARARAALPPTLVVEGPKVYTGQKTKMICCKLPRNAFILMPTRASKDFSRLGF